MEQRSFEVRFLEGKVRRLEREVVKLREQGERLLDKTLELGTDNTKLRELVRDMWNGMCGYAHECRSCEHYELYEGQRFVGECEYHRRMRELVVDE